MPRSPEDTSPPDWRPPSLRSPAPQHVPVFIWPTPSKEDYLFWVEKNGDLPKNKDFTYGDAYAGSGAGSFPNHKLVFVSPQTADTWSKWFYASDRINQDEYNWNLSDGEELIRTYLIPRADYPAEFAPPAAATVDTAFAAYGFVGDTVMDAPEELHSLYVIVKRRFIEPIVKELPFNETLRAHVLTTKEVIVPQDYDGSYVYPTVTAGTTVEIRKGNVYHDVRITQVVKNAGLTSPGYYALTDVLDFMDYNFPSKLESIDFNWCTAWAASTEAADSYSEDFYYQFKVTDARPGPYPATIKRYITSNPSLITALHPASVIPSPVRESIGMLYAWFFASTKGNRTQAYAREWEVPSTIHGEVTINKNGAGGSEEGQVNYNTESVAATPGYTTFVGLTQVVLTPRTRELPFGLFQVDVPILTIAPAALYA